MTVIKSSKASNEQSDISTRDEHGWRLMQDANFQAFGRTLVIRAGSSPLAQRVASILWKDRQRA
jgi:hypothetical protein